MRFLVFFVVFFFFVYSLFSNDSLSNNNFNQFDYQKISPQEVMTKSPFGAVLRSLLLPGLGQVYVEKYWKAPLFLVGAGVMYYYVFKHNKDFLNFSKQYDDLKRKSPNDPNLYFLKLKRDNALDNRDISIFFLIGVYSISMLDSYVDAHLFNFNVTDKISFYINFNNNEFSLTFYFNK